MEELISVIIPVYNVEKYLERCIHSVICQSYKNMEIILVDDGSTDDSGLLCDKMAEKDSRILVVHKENGGLSSARNAGLDVAAGSLITFVDSDDFIHENMLEKLHLYLKSENAELCCCACETGTDEEFPSERKDKIKINRYDGNAVFFNLFNENKTITVISCAKLYRKDIFSELRYPPGAVHEDEYLIHFILERCNTVVYVHEKLYYHFFRTDSITNSHFCLENLGIIQALEERNSFFEQMGDEELVYAVHVDFMKRVQFYYYSILKYFPQQKERAEKIKERYKALYQTEKRKMSAPERLRYGLFLYMPRINRMIKAMMGARKI